MPDPRAANSFYGFPDHYYQAKYPNKGDAQLASRIMVMLSEAGIASRGVSRGLDHGVWSGFTVGTWQAKGPWRTHL